MPPSHWALKDILQQITMQGFLFIITTFEPCHLFMRYTTVEPQEHAIPRTLRGLPLMIDKRYCFVAYKENEQEEEGDTLIHTFIKEPWPACQTRWFHFVGRMSGIETPSTSAIFKKHRPEGLLFYEPYTVEDWAPTYLWKEEYTIEPYPPEAVKIFTEEYSW